MTDSHHQNRPTSRLPEAERQAMLDRLDAAEAKNPARNKRHMPRAAFRQNAVPVRVYHPGGSTSACLVTTRNLSAGGVSFLYQGFLHGGTKIEIVLQRRQGGNDIIRGVVQHCALVNRAFHLVGARFEQKIFPKLYLDPGEWGELDDASTIDRATLSGTVLHLDDQEMDRLLLSHFLKETQIKLISVGTIAEAMGKLKEGNIDCVLCDLMLEGATGEIVITQMRAGGYAGPIALVSAESSPARIKAAQEAGAGAVLTKPFDSGKLISLLATWLCGGAAGEEPIVSSLANQEGMTPLIEQYVQKVKTLGREMRKHMDGGNLNGVRQVCQTIKGTGAGFGFNILSDLARDAVHCLDTSQSLKDSGTQIRQLEAACHRAVTSKAA